MKYSIGVRFTKTTLQEVLLNLYVQNKPYLSTNLKKRLNENEGGMM